MYKNVASQKIAIFAWDGASGASKTGDASNITAQISIDGGARAATDDTNPTELDATDAPGIYIFDMTQAETNGDLIILSATSSTSDIVIRPVIIYTQTVVTSACTAALNAYDPPTKAELDTAESNIRGSDSDDLKTLSDQIDSGLTLAQFLALK